MPDHPSRRAADVVNAVEGLLRTHLEGSAVGARPLARLAAAMTIELSRAAWGALLLDEGDGLATALEMSGSGGKPAPGAAPDRALLDRMAGSGRVERHAGRIAAPILDRGEILGALYLETRPDEAKDAAAIASDTATRIAALLRSGQLVEELTRRTESVKILEDLGACLAAGSLHGRHLDAALDGLLQATGSAEGLLVLLDSEGAPMELRTRGPEPAALEQLAARLTARLRQGRPDPDGSLADQPHLFQELRPELMPELERRQAVNCAGFVMVRRPRQAYPTSDRSFFNAVVHLLNGALARVDFFRRAAEDPLTSTGTRLALRLALAEAQANSIKTGKPWSLILVDLDRFKEINDHHGHLVGDQVLREVGQLLRRRLRSDDSVARYGGDEFVLILPMTDADEAYRLAEDLRRLAADSRFTDHKLPISFSLGVATHRQRALSLEQVLEQADRALYRSKTEGRDRVTLADAE